MEGIHIDKLILNEEDLIRYDIWNCYDSLRGQLYKADERKDCVLVQGAAFVVKGKAFLLLGVGGIDFLDSLSHFQEVDGIIGNGNALFLSRDFQNIYSAHKIEELIGCYELEGSDVKIKFLESAPIASLIFLMRSFHNLEVYDAAKMKVSKIVFEVSNTFSGEPVRCAGSLKSRLRSKFISTARVVHCARRPTLMKKECLFDSYKDIYNAVNNFKDYFALVYTLWDQVLCDAIGMRETRKLSSMHNPTDPITPYFVEIARRFL